MREYGVVDMRKARSSARRASASSVRTVCCRSERSADSAQVTDQHSSAHALERAAAACRLAGCVHARSKPDGDARLVAWNTSPWWTGAEAYAIRRMHHLSVSHASARRGVGQGRHVGLVTPVAIIQSRAHCHEGAKAATAVRPAGAAAGARA